VTALEKAGYPAGWDFKDADLLGLVAAAAEAILIPRMEWPPEYRRVAEAWFQKNPGRQGHHLRCRRRHNHGSRDPAPVEMDGWKADL
jgi:hypothetical protein